MTAPLPTRPPADAREAAAATGRVTRGQWLVLAAAIFGWMFDGLEMGLFPLVARPALQDLLGEPGEAKVALWFAVITAEFLVGAATGGVLFGWLGDRIGRVRAMTLSVLTYAVFTGLCGLAGRAEWVALFRFVAALGMGGEWALGVALVMEVWPSRSRALMAGLIGAAANVGFVLIAVIGLGLGKSLSFLAEALPRWGLSSEWTTWLLAYSGWRLLMLVGAFPALLTFLIRIFVPESESWQHERAQGSTSHWRVVDLLGVVVGAAGPQLIIFVWVIESSAAVRIAGTVLGLLVVTAGYIFPVHRYLNRSAVTDDARGEIRPTLVRMLLAAALAGVALLGTWGTTQWAPNWVDQLTGGKMPEAKAYVQICSGIGAILGTILGAMLGDWLGRRATYVVLCLASLASVLALYQLNDHFGAQLLALVFVAGMCTASFYGWLPLYLPELFRTRVRATAQGFSFNFGRILAAIGALQMANLVRFFDGYPNASAVMSLVYVIGVAIVWLLPETRGQPLPE